MTPERIHELCRRVVQAEDAAFEYAITELSNALDLWEELRHEQDKKGSAASA